ncbi:nucleotidyltransferase DUF294, putative [Geotalea daltonii FRC-32]|uniref:Nucleotidyltransferase DUF294, putative n=1 Tax=Geotalea daltonii (strain DSM 22248 / JCM 15807 / FRC-32) TaxID=316067 RepID=B9M8N2_GEODF|nr:putative nucleotidyltransferase substrate binding domain-containing protein [Geotalea daltonii]ACM18567.1 nucleotidyltransferase DUF294, putative [Geotalea daltonii FRC-32]
MDRLPTELSLSQVDRIVRERLARLDISPGEEFLALVRGALEPLQGSIATARSELRSLVAMATAAEELAVLRSINERLVGVASDLFLATGSTPMVQEICTAAREAIVERVLELARRELYFAGSYCEAPLSLFAVGSAGRREELLFSDQDYLFLHGSGEVISVQMGEEPGDYFASLGSVFVNKLEAVGISRCSGGIMPVNEAWRGSVQQWESRLSHMLRLERSDWEKSIVNLIALMDVRFICGDRDLGLGFGKSVRSRVRENPQAIRHMARVVSSMRLSKGFLRRFVVEADGLHRGEFNIKVMAWMPLVMCVRLLAVHVGIEETSTPARIDRLRDAGRLTDQMASELADAYHVITGHRLLQQNRLRKRIIDDACYINPHELPGPERERLRKAIGSIDDLQNMIRSEFSMATSADRFINRSR